VDLWNSIRLAVRHTKHDIRLIEQNGQNAGHPIPISEVSHRTGVLERFLFENFLPLSCANSLRCSRRRSSVRENFPVRKPVAAAIGSSAVGVMTKRLLSSINRTFPPALTPSFRRSCQGMKICPFEEIFEIDIETSTSFEYAYQIKKTLAIHKILLRKLDTF
jgi:hypothetical protein